MINLATFRISEAGGFAEVRRKIYLVAGNLGFPEVNAGRFATAWSQIIRSNAATLSDATLTIGIEVDGARPTFQFSLEGPAVSNDPVDLLRHCCQNVRLEALDGDRQRIVAAQPLPPRHAPLDDITIATQRAILVEKSVYQLTNELAEKNVELERHQENLEKTIEARTAELSASHAMLAGIQENMIQGLSAYDPNLNLIGWNERFRSFYKLPEGFLVPALPLEAIVRFIAERGDFGPGGLERKISERLAQLTSGSNTPIEIVIGGERTYDVFSKSTPDGGLVITYTDITERKVMEQELIKAREAAEVAAETKANFLATMSHEIRTPMNGVMSMSEILDQTKLTADQRSMTKTIRQSADALLTVINDILDFSKIEAGKLDIEEISFDLIDVVESTADLMAPRAEANSIDFLIDVDAALPSRLTGDPNRIRQLLLNLASNAIKFTDEGSVEFRVFVVGDSRNGAMDNVKEAGGDVRIRFEIVDTGIGLTEEQQGKLFNAFTQADASTSRKYGGTGLGLSICKRLCELMQGEIDVESTPGKGSTFWFELPFKVDGAPIGPEHDLSDARALLVGYGTREGEIFSRYLERGGVTKIAVARTAFSAQPALKGALARLGATPDLVFVNAKPGLHVIRSTIAELRDTEGMATRPVVLTAYHAAASTLGANDLNREGMTMQGALTCPVRLKRVWHMVAVALGKADIGDDAISNEADHVVYEPPDMATAHTHKAAILVAEDNETNQIVIRRILNRMGFAHDIAENGEAALVLYEQHPYGLLLTDFHMPKMDGFELTAAIRAAEADRGIMKALPIVALTADALPQTEQQCLDAGMNGYLRKPIEMAKLEAVLIGHLEHALPLRTIQGEQSDREDELSAAPPSVDPEVFDPAQLEDSFGPFDAGAAKFVMDFLGSLRHRIGELAEALAANNPAEARKIAHAQKGAALSIGARRVGDIMGTIQDMLDAEDMETAKMFVEILPDSYAELQSEAAPLCNHYLK